MLFNHNAESFLLTLSRLSERTQEKLFIHRRRALYKEGESGFQRSTGGRAEGHWIIDPHTALRPRCQTLGNPGKGNQDGSRE